MKMTKRVSIAALGVLLLLLAACSSGVHRYELTNHMGKSVASFEKRSGTKLAEQSNGVYLMEGVVQVLAQENKVSSITLLENAGKYTLFGVGIGMTKDTVDGLIKEVFGKEVTKTSDSSKSSITYSYLKDNKQLYVIYDKDKNTVTGVSYYKITAEQNTTATTPPGSSGEMLLMVGDTEVYYSEAMVFLKLAKDQYEADYGKGIWKVDILGNGETFGEMIKKEVINQITEIMIIRAEAKKQDIELTEEERSEANNYAKAKYDGINNKDRKRYLITEELLRQFYYDNLLANKMFENLTIDVDTKVSDEEAKQITVMDIFIQNYNLDSEGKKVSLSAEDKTAAYEKVKALLTQAKETKDFKALAEANTEAEDTEYTFGKGEGPAEFGETFEKAAFSLKTGEISDIVAGDTGWHIISCVTDFNDDATTQVKESIIEQRRNDMFSELYSKWSVDYEVVVNQEAWDSILLEE
jgi:parvulin-like peptidyl-prolyl isomerase